MARNVWEIPINDETSEEDLHRCVFEAQHSSDRNFVRAASRAAAELARRQRAEWRARLALESKERVNSQKFQQKQVGEQLNVAEKQATAARSAVWAAWAAAIATISIAIFSAISMFGTQESPPSQISPCSVEECAVRGLRGH